MLLSSQCCVLLLQAICRPDVILLVLMQLFYVFYVFHVRVLAVV